MCVCVYPLHTDRYHMWASMGQDTHLYMYYLHECVHD